jgi:hypothetical protein
MDDADFAVVPHPGAAQIEVDNPRGTTRMRFRRNTSRVQPMGA